MILIPINSSVSIPNSKPPSPNRNKLAEERTALEAQIAAQDRAGKLIIETEGIDIYPVDRNTKEARLKLRETSGGVRQGINPDRVQSGAECWSSSS
jgi:hypothetical protein